VRDGDGMKPAVPEAALAYHLGHVALLVEKEAASISMLEPKKAQAVRATVITSAVARSV
jgi:hypothetical protein